MKKIAYILISLLSVAGLLTSCDKEFLETKPLTEFSEVDVWNDPALVETFINQIYWRLDEPFSNGRLKSNIVDEGHYRGNGASKNFNNSLLTVDQIPGWSTPSRYRSWDDIYKTIRYCNIFFANIDKVPFESTVTDGKTLGDRMKGEVHFLRAFLYHELTAVYGGVPIITEPYGLTDEFLIERSSYSDCVDFMVEELDLAAGLLPATHSGDAKGRATKGAALALKSRVLLYAASDLYNTTVFQGYSNPELIGYTGGSRTDRWTSAKNAAKAVMDLGTYSLYKANPAPTDSVARNLAELFIAKDTEEDIFIKYFTTNQAQMYGIVTGPNGYHNWGTNAPIQEMVDAYEMKDGSKFSWTNPAHAALPYANREPRFYSTILYEGSVWKPRPADVQNIDPVGIIQAGKWERWDEASQSKKIYYGVDTRQSTVENWNGSYTGYYLRKGLDPAVDAQYFYATVPWRWIRYGEILLNYAEACIELGGADLQTGLDALNLVRKRAGMPPRITSDQATAREYVRHERRIEMAFEEQRFFDVRRWVIGPEVYKPIKVADITYKMNPDKTTATVPTIVPVAFETWKWIDKAYFFPILRAEMSKNSKLIQNPGY
jgi:hypothetical protein